MRLNWLKIRLNRGNKYVYNYIVSIYHACEKELPADYHRNWKLEQGDANKVRFGEMSRSQFIKNMNNGKYR